MNLCGSSVAFKFCKYAGEQRHHCDAALKVFYACQYADVTGAETKAHEQREAAGLTLVERDGFYVYEKPHGK